MSNTIKYSHTLWSPSDTVKDVAEVLGISNLPEEVAKTLAMDIEYRIHEIIEQAMKFMRHNKKSTLTTSDISQALRVLNIEPMYGYEAAALTPLNYREAMVGPGQTLYYIDEDEDMDFEKIINQPLPKVPRAVSFTAHWLAIEGVQPAIPQNPHSTDIKAMPPQLRGSQASSVSTISALSDSVDVKPLVKHVISKELQLYFDRVVQALISRNANDEQLKNSALSSLRNDPGLHQLVPYFVQFVQEKISENLKSSDLSVLMTLLQVISALLSNPTIFIEPYVHHLMPSVLTPLLAKRVGPKQPSQAALEESYDIRNFAASLLKQICFEFGNTYHNLKPRVTRTLLKAFMDVLRPLPALYGVVVGIQALGTEIVRVVIVGNLKTWYQGVISKMKETSDIEKKMLDKAIVEALRSLKFAPSIQVDQQSSADKLTESLGPEVSQMIMGLPDGQEIANGVLLGEFKE